MTQVNYQVWWQRKQPFWWNECGNELAHPCSALSITMIVECSSEFQLQKAFKFQLGTEPNGPETICARVSQTQRITVYCNIKAHFAKEEYKSRVGREKCQ